MLSLGLSLCRPSSAIATPADVAGLQGWWEAGKSVVTVARDGTGAVAANGDLVGRATDLSANARHLEASADGARATLAKNWIGSGVDFFRFTTGKNLVNAAAGAALAGVNQPWTIFVVNAVDQHGGERYLWGLAASGNLNCRVNGRNVGTITAADLPLVRLFHRHDAAGGTNTFNSPPGYGGGLVGLFAFQFTGTRLKAWQNGFLLFDEAATTGTFTFTHFSLACSWNGSAQTGDGDLIAAAAVYAGALSDVNRGLVERYFANLVRIPYTPGATLARRYFWLGDSRYERFEGAPGQDGEVVTRRAARMCLATETIHICRALAGSTLAGADTSDLTEQWADTDSMVADGDVVLLNCGVNDIRLNATIQGDSTPFTATAGIVDGTYWPQFQAVADGVMVENCDCICDAMIPARSGLWTGGEKFGVDRWNVLLQQWCGRYDRATCNMQVLHAVTTAGFLNVADSSDTLHLNSSGHPKHAASLLPHIAHLRTNPATQADLVRWWTARTGLRFDDADPIGDTGLELVDRSTTGDHAIQGTVGSRPTWRIGTAASNYQATVRFDGVDDHLECSEFVGSAWTIVLAVDAAAFGPVLATSTGLANVLWVDAASGLLVVTTSGGALSFSSAPWGAFAVIVVRSDGRAWVNGVEMVRTSTPANYTISTNRIGGVPGGEFFAGDLAGVMICDVALGASDVNALAGYEAFKLGKSWATVVN
jgi:hypothetical protein